MDVAHPIVGDTHLSHFSPLDRLAPALREELLSCSCIERLPPGRRLFQRDEPDTRTVFLLSGQLALVSEDHTTRMVRADSSEARTAIDPHAPHRLTALTRTSVTILSVDTALLASLLARSGSAALTECAGDTAPDDTRGQQLFAGPLFSHLPRPHLLTLQRRAYFLRLAPGDTLIREGEPSRYYYLIEQGSFRLSRRSRGRNAPLMESGPGDGIGEQDLITDSRCGFTASALESSRVARFSKGEFLTLLLRPHLRPVTYGDMLGRQRAGAVLLDVRPLHAFRRGHLAGGIPLPLQLLRQTARLLDRSHDYIVYADKPSRGATAAFLLACHGIVSAQLSEPVPPEHVGRASGARGFAPLHETNWPD